MTPAQQSALESVVGRALTQDEIAQLDPLLAIRNDVAIAQVLSVGRTRLKSTPIGIGTILAVMAPNGGAFLDSLEAIGASDPNIKWLIKLIEQGTFDVGMPASRQQMTVYAQAVPSIADGINALLQLGVEDDSIQINVVSDALNLGGA